MFDCGKERETPLTLEEELDSAPKRVLEGLAHYFEHDQVFKLLYMDNICPLSLSEFWQIFLK